MELFTYLMAKNDHNTSVKKDLFSYLLGKNQSGTYTDYSGTSLSINNTKKAKMKVNLLGNTSQETTTGKQLFSYPYKDTSASPKDQSGVIWTDLGDGRIKANGTPSGYTSFDMYSQTSPLVVKPNTTYTIGIISSNINLRFSFSEYDDNNTLVTTHDNITIKTFTTSATTTKLVGGIKRNANNTAINNVIVEPMLVEGSYTSETMPSFEIFTGGSPSPSPSYPEIMHNVNGDNEVVVTGKNIFDENYYSSTNLYASASIYFAYVKMPDSFKTKFYGNMTLKGTSQSLVLGFSTSNISVSPRMLDNGALQSNVEYDFTSATDVYLVIGNSNRIDIARDIPLIFNNYNIMISKTSGETYEPYQSSTYPINLPVENIFNELPTQNPKTGITISNDRKSVEVDLTAGNDMYFFIMKNFESITTKTYTIAFEVSGVVSGETIKYNLWGGGTYFTLKNGRNVCVIPSGTTLNQNAILWDDQARSGTETSVLTFTNFMIVDGEYTEQTMPSYTPYGTTPIELCKIGTYQDKFIRNSGKQVWDEEWEVGAYAWATGEKVVNNQTIRSKNKMPIKPSTTYYVTIPSEIVIEFFDSSDTFLGTSTNVNKNSSSSFTTPSNASYFVLYMTSTYGTTYKNDIMINEGETALPYEPYGNGDWYLEKYIGKYTFPGNDIWGEYPNSVSGLYKAYSTDVRLGRTNNFEQYTYCNYFNVLTNYGESTTKVGYVITKNAFYISVPTSIASSTNEVQTFISNTKPVCYYILSSPTYTKITYQPLINQLNALKNSRSNNGQTNISQINNDLPFELDVSVKVGN